MSRLKRNAKKWWRALKRLGKIDSVVYAPPGISGGVKSLYTVCGWLQDLGESSIVPVNASTLVDWFEHSVRLYQKEYEPHLVAYPAKYPCNLGSNVFHLCCVFGKYKTVEPHADLVVCKSPDTLEWIKQHNPGVPTVIVAPSIRRARFEYDGRPKQDQICYMTRPNKSPETAVLLRERYGDKLVEIINQPEAAVAEMLKSAKVFVWRSSDKEGSPRPPKEALVAGCVVVGLKDDLNAQFYTDFGVRCSSVDELIRKAGEALTMPMPTVQERAVVRDSEQEKQDWLQLIRSLKVKRVIRRKVRKERKMSKV
jgi:hypothetical protein